MATRTIQNLPPQYVQDIGKDYATQLAGLTGIALDTSRLAPQVAAQDPLQQQAYNLTQSGIGAYQPYITQAAAFSGPQAYQSFMSPYQQDVIDASLAEFDRQAQIRKNQQAAATLGVPGAFGGGREGVQLAEFDAASDRNRAALQAGLLQTSFESAAARRQQDLANQLSISQQQRGLGAAAQDFSRAQISGLGTLGAAQQAQQQAILDAQRQAAQMAVDDPRRRLSMLGAGITQLTPGAGAVTLAPEPAAAQASPLTKALGLGLAGAAIGAFFSAMSGAGAMSGDQGVGLRNIMTNLAVPASAALHDSLAPTYTVPVSIADLKALLISIYFLPLAFFFGL